MVEPVSVSPNVVSSTVFSLRKEEPHGTEDLGSAWSSSSAMLEPSGGSNCACVGDDAEQICLALSQRTSVPLLAQQTIFLEQRSLHLAFAPLKSVQVRNNGLKLSCACAHNWSVTSCSAAIRLGFVTYS